jgi:arylsulfatase
MIRPCARILPLLLALGCTPAQPRPNLLLVTIDTLRADRLGLYGFEGESSPNLDAFSQGAVVFERAIAASSRTAPSHASIFTGRWARDHSVGVINGSSRLGDEATLAGTLAAAGWETAAFVSNSVLHSRIGLDSGFAHYDDSLPDAEANRAHIFERHAEQTTRSAVAWLEGERPGPWFVWVQYNDPHGPYTPPPHYIAQARPRLDGEERPLPVLQAHAGELGIPAYQRFGDERYPEQYRARYAGEIRYTDAWLGRLLEAADAQSGGRDTVILVTADHGEALGEENRYFQHGSGTTPNLVHVPLIVRAPGATPARYPEPVHHVDIAPTLLELAGLPQIEGGAGLSLVPRWRDDTPPPERTLFADTGVEVTGYRGDRFVRKRDPHVQENWSFSAHRWESARRWSPDEPDPALLEQVRSYSKDRAPMRRTGPMPRDLADRLHALGYVE